MEARESFTGEEISSIIESLGFETTTNDPIDDDDAWVIQCEQEDVQFSCIMRPHGIVERLILVSSRFLTENAFKFVNQFNSIHAASGAYVLLDDDGHVTLDSDGDPTVAIRMLITFDGGVSASHLEFLFATWIEDLLDFFEIDAEDAFPESELPEMVDEVREMTVSEQVEWVLSDSVSRSAREIADHLMLDKHEVNSALYKDKSKFHRDGGQPPRWTLVN